MAYLKQINSNTVILEDLPKAQLLKHFAYNAETFEIIDELPKNYDILIPYKGE